MNAKKFSDAMSELDNKYIDEALNYKKKVKKPIWIKWGAMVASLLLVFTMMLSRLVDTFFSRTSWTMLLYAENHSISVA